MKTIHHVVDIDAAPDDVYDAVTTRAGLAGWWSTKVDLDEAAVGHVIHFTFGGGFDPDMEITEMRPKTAVAWKCIGGHEPWDNGDFRFEVEPLDGRRTRLRFWQEYAIELEDTYYGIYNFNWGYYLESLRLLCVEGSGKPYVVP